MGQDRDHRRLTTPSRTQSGNNDPQATRTRSRTPSARTTVHRDRPGWRLNVATLNGATATLVTVEGQVDVSVADRLCNELLGCLERRPRRLLVDLAGVTLLDAAAINALLLVSRSGTRRGVPVMLVAAPQHVQCVLTMLNLDDALAHASSVREALARTDEQTGDPGHPSATGSTST
jgi:anti-sigma B factor antagonist